MVEKIALEDLKEELFEKLRNKYFIALLAILGFSAFIRFKYAFFEGMWVDESIHGRLAKELPNHLLSYSLPEMKGQLIKRPPVYNYLITISNMTVGKLTGTDTAIRIVSPLMGTIGVGATYLLGKEVENKEVGLIAAILIAVNGTFWFLSERILMGATLTTLFTLTIFAIYYGLEDRKYSKYAIWSWGPLIVLSALTKQPGYLLGPIAVTYFLWKKREDIKDYFFTDKDFKESNLYDLVTDKNYYIALGLFGLTMLPWAIRNMFVCGFPLCSLAKALEIAGSGPGSNLDVRGTFFFLVALPSILGQLVASILGLKVLKNGFDSFRDNHDLFIKKIAVSILFIGSSYVLWTELTPFAILMSLSMFALRDAEKLFWIAAAFGIGVLSFNATKVPRYIVFIIPALLTVVSLGVWRFSTWVSEQVSEILPEKASLLADPRLIALIILIPLFLTSFVQGSAQVSRNSFQALEPAGEWIAQNTEEDVRMYSTSPQIRYWAYPRTPVSSAGRVPGNETGFKKFLAEENISIVIIDIYERTQPDWMNLGIPPYRLTPSHVRSIRSGQKTPKQLSRHFKPIPDYLTPLKSFGNTRMPLTRQNQPEVVIYAVNSTAL